jgi:hypothetical protein
MSKGVLKVTVPKPAPAQAKKIDIKAPPERRRKMRYWASGTFRCIRRFRGLLLSAIFGLQLFADHELPDPANTGSCLLL